MDKNKTYLWWRLLCAVAIINIIAWCIAVYFKLDTGTFSATMPVLSGLYVAVCAFRSFFPRIDLERYCLIDSPWSSMVIGRSAATVAEICFSIQVAILIYELGLALQLPWITTVAWLLPPIIVLAQISCWYAMLTLNHFWHGVEEFLWVIMIGLASGCLLAGILLLDGWSNLLMLIGLVSCAFAAYIMIFVDIPMYLQRSRQHRQSGGMFLTVDSGVQDALSRRVPTADWAIWKNEVIWITTYFTFGVWLSIGMIFVKF